jgi:hypothetical protein
MAETRVPSVLWNVSQSLDKEKKETARTNIGINGIIHNPVAHEFVSAINEDSNGNLSVSGAVPTTADVSGLVDALDALQSNIADHKHTVQFNSETAIDLTANNSSAISLNHSHGAITTDGKIRENAVSVASGMSLLIANSSKEIKNSALTFGTDSTKYLNNKGEWVQPLFYRFSYTTTTETYHSQLSIRERPTSNSGLYLDESFQGYLVPKEADGWVEGQVLYLYRGDQVTIDKPIQWGNPYLTAYNNVESTQYTPTLHAGLHLGDGFGWGLSNTIETPYNGNTFPTNTALIMEGASVTYAKTGIYGGSSAQDIDDVVNKKKISTYDYVKMLRGADLNSSGHFDSGYISYVSDSSDNQCVVCRIPPHHWALVPMCIHGQSASPISISTTVICKVVDENTPINGVVDSTTIAYTGLNYHNSTAGYLCLTALAHNNSDVVKAMKLYIGTVGTGSGATVYKQILIFKTPEEEGAFNSPDESLWPPGKTPTDPA